MSFSDQVAEVADRVEWRTVDGVWRPEFPFEFEGVIVCDVEGLGYRVASSWATIDEGSVCVPYDCMNGSPAGGRIHRWAPIEEIIEAIKAKAIEDAQPVASLVQRIHRRAMDRGAGR